MNNCKSGEELLGQIVVAQPGTQRHVRKWSRYSLLTHLWVFLTVSGFLAPWPDSNRSQCICFPFPSVVVFSPFFHSGCPNIELDFFMTFSLYWSHRVTNYLVHKTTMYGPITGVSGKTRKVVPLDDRSQQIDWHCTETKDNSDSKNTWMTRFPTACSMEPRSREC